MHEIFSMAPGKQQIYKNYKIVFTLTVRSSNITIMVSVSHFIFRH